MARLGMGELLADADSVPAVAARQGEAGGGGEGVKQMIGGSVGEGSCRLLLCMVLGNKRTIISRVVPIEKAPTRLTTMVVLRGYNTKTLVVGLIGPAMVWCWAVLGMVPIEKRWRGTERSRNGIVGFVRKSSSGD